MALLGKDCEGSIHVPLLSVTGGLVCQKDSSEDVGEPYSWKALYLNSETITN